MNQIVINGGKKYHGEVWIAGNKNAVLPCLAASIMTSETSVFHNVPDIEDVKSCIEILVDLGVKVERPDTHTLIINPATLNKFELNPDLVAKLRASILFLGPLLARTKQAVMRHPGGCIIGRRPVGTHFEAIRMLGGSVTTTEENYIANLGSERSSEVFLDEVSVTATENAMCLAAALSGKTIIMGAACEPHIVNLAQYLIAMGAIVNGAGTNRIEIEGTSELHGAEHNIAFDFIETATFAFMAAATQGEVTIHNAMEEDFHMIGVYLKSFGSNFEFVDKNTLLVRPAPLHSPTNIKEIQTRPWPGFPYDAMSPLIVLATQASGTTLFHEWMYEGRLLFTDMLVAMGANIITCDPHRVIVNGTTPLRAKNLASPDIRAGVALVLAGLLADGTTVIDNAHLVRRGYENIANRLDGLGADISEN